MERKVSELGTELPVPTNAEQFPVVVIGMGESPKPREKAAPTGEATHSSGCILRVARKDGALKADKTASVHVLYPASVYELGRIYVAKGRVWVQPYESNTRVALSITVEELIPAESLAGEVKTPAPNQAAAKKDAA